VPAAMMMPSVNDDDPEPIGGAYRGATKNGLRHGVGEYVYANKYFSYKGDWMKGLKHGKGKLTMGDGSVYEGEFALGEIDGWGTRTWPSGASYSGQFYQGEMNGTGTLVSPDGTHFEGEFASNMKHGRGREMSADGSVFEGEYEHNKRVDGSLTAADGSVYTGEWVEGEKQGRGRQDFADGSSYEGSWVQSKFHGPGRFVIRADAGESLAYDGEWEDGRPLQVAASMVFDGVVGAPAAAVEPAPGQPPALPTAPSFKGKSKKDAKAPPPEEPAEPSEKRVTIVPGGALPPLALTCLDEAGDPAASESGRLVHVLLRRYEVPAEPAAAVAEKKGGKRAGKVAELPAAPAVAPELVEEVFIASGRTEGGRLLLEDAVVPLDLRPSTSDKECELAFVDATALEDGEITVLPPALQGTASPCTVLEPPPAPPAAAEDEGAPSEEQFE